jgi:hypothetical protein
MEMIYVCIEVLLHKGKNHQITCNLSGNQTKKILYLGSPAYESGHFTSDTSRSQTRVCVGVCVCGCMGELTLFDRWTQD